MKIYIKMFLVIFACLVLTNQTNAKTQLTKDELVEKHKEVLGKIENYLNSVTNARGRFKQFSSDGTNIEGDFYLKRPGKMRLDYDLPAMFHIYASDDILTYYDARLEQVNHMDLNITPASFLLKENLDFKNANFNITNIKDYERQLSITMTSKDDNIGGNVTMTFTTDPVALRKWTIVDAQNITTEIFLEALNYNIQFEDEFFMFKEAKK
ncbi:MAG: lipoprotein chaperone [Alphaproteobacteria bacterium ADurb.Bin438]|nr:MAG: lipoprotein chaperone [Alphaproteobacteria bacterium ADurb.Bin438]